MHPLIRTERLVLEPLSADDARAIAGGQPQAGRSWADGYPTDATRVVAASVAAADREGRDLGPFRTYQIVRTTDGCVIGDCGFLGSPDRDGVVQVGYGVAESARNEGYATEALEALIGYAFTHDRVSSVRAETTRDNRASQRVMEKAGMACVEEQGNILIYEA